MIDLSKYPKIYEWDETYGNICDVSCMSQNAIYALRIGESLYINETKSVQIEIMKHIMDMRLGIHVNPKINEAFNKSKSCQVYILHPIKPFDHAINLKNTFVNNFKADLNKGDGCLEVKTDLWCSEDVFMEMWIKFIDRLKYIEKEQGIPLNRLVCAAISNFLFDYAYRNKDLLMNEGISYIDVLYREKLNEE